MSAKDRFHRMSIHGTVPVHFRDFRPDDYDRLVEINNANYPDYEVSTSEQVSRDKAMEVSKYLQRRWTCLDSTGRVVGFGLLRHVIDTFHPQKFVINILVDPSQFGKGIGSAIYRRLDQELEKLDAILAWAMCKEDLPLLRAFYKKRGFHETTWDWESTLDLESFDLSKFQSYLDKVQRAGITFTTLLEEQRRGDSNSLRKIHELTETVMADAPRTGAFTPRTYEQWEATELATPRLVPAGWVIAKLGDEFVGLSNVFKNEKDPLSLSTGDTGVLRQHRGKSLATALKIKVIESAKSKGYERIETWNDSTNVPMLAVNTRLGFRRKIGWVRTEKRFR